MITGMSVLLSPHEWLTPRDGVVYYLALVNHWQYGHTLHDSVMALYQTVRENNNGVFTRDILIVVNAGYPMSANLNTFYPWFAVLSKYPVISITQLRSFGQVCLRDVTVRHPSLYRAPISSPAAARPHGLRLGRWTAAVRPTHLCTCM